MARWFATALALCLAWPAWAQSPEDLVRWIYTSLARPPDRQARGLHHLTTPEQRRTYLSQRLVRLYDANDIMTGNGQNLAAACFEPGFEIPGNDYDAAEIARTLATAATGDATRQRVTARFSSFGEPAQIHFDFIVEDGFWRLDDVGGPGWQLSDRGCDTGTAPAPAGNTGYCYKTEGDEFRFHVGADGRARFSLESWQGGGHSCGVSGIAHPTEGGWVHESDEFGRPCRLEFRITPESGIRLGDAGHDCKMVFCGQRAVLDGLTFGRAAQVACDSLPPPPQY
ncbi:hypothetical protein [Pukyongiella litopenaei]|uniref:DUF3828 domain-containing protein n=1 Tax=Pukyongiella litopenaei TaxID=2605946 RepID=A0A2S0MNZ0_9RHOB|nr:hypothetical protein [Pukyongiella litopenaei]AVO37588.2 hypothetical protein C6Y53_07650 [Pukyongiella litopenaei]